MKVERKKGKFEPIVITLETEKEAVLMWNLLNCGDFTSFSKYLDRTKKENYGVELLRNWKCWGVWTKFNEVYDPRKELKGDC